MEANNLLNPIHYSTEPFVSKDLARLGVVSETRSMQEKKECVLKLMNKGSAMWDLLKPARVQQV